MKDTDVALEYGLALGAIRCAELSIESMVRKDQSTKANAEYMQMEKHLKSALRAIRRARVCVVKTASKTCDLD